MKFARRTNWELTPNRISGILENFKKSGQTVLDLTESNPTRCLAYPQKDILLALSQVENMAYMPTTKGLLSAREAVAAYYKQKGIDVSVEQIFLTASTSEAYSFLFRLLADPGETILFPSPSYPLFDFLVDLNDLKQGFYPLEYAQTWTIDFEALQDNFSSGTKALVTVNPNNPTGSFVKKQELEQLNTICSRNQCALISDEVFFDYAWESNPDFVSFAGNQENLTFTLGGLSKTLGLPQMKLSWIVVSGPSEVVKDAMARLEVIADTYLSVNTPVQNALGAWMKLRPTIQDMIMQRIAVNRDIVTKTFNGLNGISLLRCEGGWYMILKLLGAIDEERLIEDLLIKDQVYVHPGYFFNFSEEPYLILSLLPPEHVLGDGVNKIAARIKQ